MVAFAIVFAPYLRSVLPDHQTTIYWSATILVGIYIRWLGWSLRWPPGSLGRHAIAFFCATTGCVGMIFLLNYVFYYEGSSSRLLRDVPEGLGAAAMIFGILCGATIELVFWLASQFRPVSFSTSQ